MAVEWGNVGEWVGGLAAAAGLAFAGWEVRVASRRRREDQAAQREAVLRDQEFHREAMGRSVSVQAIPNQREDGTWFCKYEVHNGGDYPINGAVVVIGDPGAEDYRPLDQVGTASETVIGTIAAGSSVNGTFDHLHFSSAPAFAELTGLASVLFTDAWGQHWASSPTGLEKRLAPPRIC